MSVVGYSQPQGMGNSFPALPERILESAVQGLSANMTVDPRQPEQLASMAVGITEAVMKQVTGKDFKVSWGGLGIPVNL